MTDDSDECASSGCFLEPAFSAVVVLRTHSDRKAEFSAPLGLSFCRGCAVDVRRLDDLMDDQTWETIARGFEAAGKERPDRDLCSLEMREIPKVLLP